MRAGHCEQRARCADPLVANPQPIIGFHIERGGLLDVLEHPKPDRCAGQRIFVVRREDYVSLIPFVKDEDTVFLKTIIPSRTATKLYLTGCKFSRPNSAKATA